MSHECNSAQCKEHNQDHYSLLKMANSSLGSYSALISRPFCKGEGKCHSVKHLQVSYRGRYVSKGAGAHIQIYRKTKRLNLIVMHQDP